MREFVAWINGAMFFDGSPFLRAALAHYHLSAIHPFHNGNGRSCRLAEALILKCAGIHYLHRTLSNYYYRNLDDYYWAFSKVQKNKENNVTPFLLFVLDGMIESLTEIRQRCNVHVRKLVLRDYYRRLCRAKVLTKRQEKVLQFVLAWGQPFQYSEMVYGAMFAPFYAGVSERTIQRDIKKMKKLNLLTESKIKDGNREFTVDLFVLDPSRLSGKYSETLPPKS